MATPLGCMMKSMSPMMRSRIVGFSSQLVAQLQLVKVDTVATEGCIMTENGKVATLTV